MNRMIWAERKYVWDEQDDLGRGQRENMYVMNRIKEIYMIWSISSVGMTDINNGFLTR